MGRPTGESMNETLKSHDYTRDLFGRLLTPNDIVVRKRNDYTKDVLGQFFTPSDIVARMLGLRQNKGKILEPSAGNGAFMNVLEDSAVGVEIDGKLCIKDKRIINTDFFNFPIENSFDTIIGNPPYVRHQDINETTKSILDMNLFDKRSNLYLFFIAKCISHLNDKGELIFITPRDFLKATSAQKLNALLYDLGSMTHYYEMGDMPIFDDASPNCAIWRWEKGLKTREMKTGGVFNCINGQIIFDDSCNSILSDFFDIKVGAVSGADEIFTNSKYGTTDMVCSHTRTTSETKKVIYNEKHECLIPHKEYLMGRRIKQFTEHNWWHWGRNYCEREGERIYVNAKTRQSEPFFQSEVTAYDGSVLALFPKKGVDISKAVIKLNEINWDSLGFICDGRLSFTQRSLANIPIEI